MRGENDRARGDRMQVTVRAAAIIGARGVRHLGDIELNLSDEVEAVFELSARQLVVACDLIACLDGAVDRPIVR